MWAKPEFILEGGMLDHPEAKWANLCNHSGKSRTLKYIRGKENLYLLRTDLIRKYFF